MAWGLLLCFLNFKINNIPLLPDPLGWIIIIVALRRIRDVHVTVPNLVILAWIELALSVVQLLEPVLIGASELKTLTPIFYYVDRVVWLIFLWLLLGVVLDIARHLENEALQRKADFRRKFVVFVSIGASCVGSILAWTKFPGGWLVVFPLLALKLIMLIMVFTLMWHAARVCRPDVTDLPEAPTA